MARDCTQSTPLLGSIDFTYVTLAGTAEMLARAKEAPLHLKARVTSFRWNRARCRALDQQLQAHVSHIRHLDIITTSLETCHLLWPTLHHTLSESPAPILEYLSLSNDSSSGVVSIPNNVFKGITPRLFSLNLLQVTISWKSPLLRGPRYLKIYELKNDNTLSVTDWLDALDEMPQLKELILYAASPLADGFTFPSDVKRTATLPVLTRLELSSPPRACALALAHLVLPALTSLILTAQSFDNTGSDALILTQYLTQHAHGRQASPEHALPRRHDTHTHTHRCVVHCNTQHPRRGALPAGRAHGTRYAVHRPHVRCALA